MKKTISYFIGVFTVIVFAFAITMGVDRRDCVEFAKESQPQYSLSFVQSGNLFGILPSALLYNAGGQQTITNSQNQVYFHALKYLKNIFTGEIKQRVQYSEPSGFFSYVREYFVLLLREIRI